MTYEGLRRRFAEALGTDALVSFDDDLAPTRLMIYRPDALADDAIRAAVGSALKEFPNEMVSITDIVLFRRAKRGLSRRRFPLI